MERYSFVFRHKFISFLVDLNLRGVNSLAVFLSNKLIPRIKVPYILKTIHGVEIPINPELDKGGLEANLHRFGTYEKGVIDFMLKNLKSDDTFLDVGANIGLLTAIAAKKAKKVLSVEANPKTIPILLETINLNKIKNVEVYDIGLGAEKGMLRFFENWNVNRGGASFLQQDQKEGVKVQIDTIDNLFSYEAISMVKIDVEGFELNVLKGGIQTFKKNHPIFIIEVSKDRENIKGVSPEEILDFVKSIGNYKIFKLAGTKERVSKLIEIITDSDLPSHDNIFCIPN